MDFLVNALRSELGTVEGVSSLLDKITALHAKELKDLKFEVALYRKEAFRLQNENDDLRSQLENLRGQARNVSPASTVPAPPPALTSSNTHHHHVGPATTTTANTVVPAFFPSAPSQRQSPYLLPPVDTNNPIPTTSNTNAPSSTSRMRQQVKLPTARRTKSLEHKPRKPHQEENSNFLRSSFPLEPPLPRKFQGDRDAAMRAELPVFDEIVNFPQPFTDSVAGQRQCTMCGTERPFHVKAEHKDDIVIPNQNKGVCTACDSKVWVVKESTMQVKWCKGCKNFQKWYAFGDKGWATKCCACRKRMADSYAAKKEQKRARVP